MFKYVVIVKINFVAITTDESFTKVTHLTFITFMLFKRFFFLIIFDQISVYLRPFIKGRPDATQLHK